MGRGSERHEYFWQREPSPPSPDLSQGKSLAWLGLGREGCGGTEAGDVRRRQPQSFVYQVECLVQ